MNDENATHVFVLSAPSGAGKTSLARALLDRFEHLSLSVSHTTRAQRPGEVDGSDYYFVSNEKFERMIKGDAFLEYARVFDHYYGTSERAVREILGSGRGVVLDIDWQGARRVRERIPGTCSIFILPPSREVLERRLRDRGRDTDAIIAQRMWAAKDEIIHFDEFEHVVINECFETAIDELSAIVFGQTSPSSSTRAEIQDVVDRLLA